jgi:hypothetical protein
VSVVLVCGALFELLHHLHRGVHGGGDEQHLHPAGVRALGQFGLLVGDDLAADAAVGDGDVGVFGFVLAAGVPVLRPRPAGGTDALLVLAPGQGLVAVAGSPGAVSDAPELGVWDAVLLAQLQLLA